MDIKTAVDSFFYQLTLNELHLMNTGTLDGNLTYNSLLYLDLIRMKENCTVSYLAQVLHVAKSAVTIKVKELQQLGLVTKTQSQSDKRIYYLHVVDHMEPSFACYDVALSKAEEEMTKQYTKEQIDCFCEMLQVFAKYYPKE